MKLKLYTTKEGHASECLFGVGHCKDPQDMVPILKGFVMW